VRQPANLRRLGEDALGELFEGIGGLLPRLGREQVLDPLAGYPGCPRGGAVQSRHSPLAPLQEAPPKEGAQQVVIPVCRGSRINDEDQERVATTEVNQDGLGVVPPGHRGGHDWIELVEHRAV
jgi:hypothetical protein